MLDSIILQPEQKALLVKLVEAFRNVPSQKRQKFTMYSFHGDNKTETFIDHPGLGGKTLGVYEGDIDNLSHSGLLNVVYISSSSKSIDITPSGFQYYESLKQQVAEPVQRVEKTIMDNINSSDFQAKYPTAFQKWSTAEAMLWSAESELQLTTIGHLCREAMQEFADVLIVKYQLTETEKDKSRTISRIKSVLRAKQNQLPNTIAPFLEALLAYWGTVNDLVQRQEHGGQKEREPLIWEDARRVIFYTLLVMVEYDRTI